MKPEPGPSVRIEDDRWVVLDRGAHLQELVSTADTDLDIAFDNGLSIVARGGWSGSIGSPRTGPRADFADADLYVGTHVLSLVLFEAGSIRLALSSGLFIVAGERPGSYVEVERPGAFSWRAESGVVTHKWM